MRIGIVAGTRFPIREPYAGGMEAHTHALARSLQAQGHDVVLFAAGGPDDVHTVALPAPLQLSREARADVSMPAERFMAEHHAYLRLLLDMDAYELDVLHNNSLHYLPVAMSGAVAAPVVTTLHSPPTPWLESAVATVRPGDGAHFISVSASNARSWEPTVDVAAVVHNGVDTDRWRPTGHARRGLVWSGRIVPEKGTHLAIAAARRLGAPLTIAGPAHDRAYFDAEVAPHLSRSIRYAGHLHTDDLAALVAGAEVAIATPQWEEPYGLIVAEAMACGTPVAACPRGAMTELIADDRGRVARDGSVEALAAAISAARDVDPAACRAWATTNASVAVMGQRYADFYADAVAA